MGDVTIRGVQHLTWIRPGEEVRTARSPLVDGAIKQGRVLLVEEHPDAPVLVPCEACKGSGRRGGGRCRACAGSGTVEA